MGLILSGLGGNNVRHHKVSWLALLTIFLGLVYVGGSWSPSHYGVALQIIGAPELGPTLGEARPIRSDEWAVLTPYFQIAVANGLTGVNAISPYHETLRSFFALPINDWSIVFKPQLWGFLLAPPHYAYSFYFFFLMASFVWGFAILFRQLGFELRFAVITALLLFFSRFVQVWWTSNAPTLAFAAWPMVAVLAPVSWPWRLALVFYAVGVWFFGLIYPPFMIGSAFVMVVLLIAFRRDALKVNVVLPALLGGAAAVALVMYYLWDVIAVMQNTVYPGSRVASGGGENWLLLLSHLFPYIAAKGFEPTIPNSNACEVGTVASFLPLMLLTFADYRQLAAALRLHVWSAVTLGIGILLMLVWLVLPLPPAFGKAFLWHLVPSHRLLWGFGLLTTVAFVWLASITSWRVSVGRVAVFIIAVCAAWFGAKHGSPLKNWFDGAVLVSLILTAALAAALSLNIRQGRSGLWMAGVAALTSAVTFGTFNPLQSTRPIFDPPTTPWIESMRRLGAANPNGWVTAPQVLGTVLGGLGVPAINHVLLQPQLDFFRRLFPDMEFSKFNYIFNRYMHVFPGPISEPSLLQGDLVEVPIIQLGTPLPLSVISTVSATKPVSQNQPQGQLERLTLDTAGAIWRLRLEGWIPITRMHPQDSLELQLPTGIVEHITSSRAVRIIRSDMGISGLDGGFIAEIEGSGQIPDKVVLASELRITAQAADGTQFSIAGQPLNPTHIRISSPDVNVTVPQRAGYIDSIQLAESGREVLISGWLPAAEEMQAADEIVVLTDLPAEKAEINWGPRPDVVQAKAATYLLTGFTIRIKLLSKLQQLPKNGYLCIAAANQGNLTMMTHNSVDITNIGCYDKR